MLTLCTDVNFIQGEFRTANRCSEAEKVEPNTGTGLRLAVQRIVHGTPQSEGSDRQWPPQLPCSTAKSLVTCFCKSCFIVQKVKFYPVWTGARAHWFLLSVLSKGGCWWLWALHAMGSGMFFSFWCLFKKWWMHMFKAAYKTEHASKFLLPGTWHSPFAL